MAQKIINDNNKALYSRIGLGMKFHYEDVFLEAQQAKIDWVD